MSALGLQPGEFGEPWFLDRQSQGYLEHRSAGQAQKDQRLPRWSVRQKYRALDGRRAEISASGKTKGDAKARLDRRRALIEATFAPAPNGKQMSFEQAAAGWLAHRRDEDVLKPQSLHKYERIVALDLLPTWGQRIVAEITTNELDAWLETVALTRDTDKIRTTLRQIFRWARKRGARDDDPTLLLEPEVLSGARRDRKAKRRETALSDSELTSIRHAVIAFDTHRTKPGPKGNGANSMAYLLMEEAGGRIGEVLGLRHGDVHLRSANGPYVHFSGTLVENTGVTFHRQDHTKSDNRWVAEPGRRIGISDELAADLEHWIAKTPGADPASPLFPTRNGTWIRPSNFRKWLARALTTDTNAPSGIYPHLLRKTVVTAIAEEDGIEHAQALAGHSSPKTTQTHYVRPAVTVIKGHTTVRHRHDQ